MLCVSLLPPPSLTLANVPRAQERRRKICANPFTTPSASPAGMRPMREHGVAGKPSPHSAAKMPPPPSPKRRASAGCSSGSTAGSTGSKRPAWKSPERPLPQSRLSWADLVRTPAPRPHSLFGGVCDGLGTNLCRWCFADLSMLHEGGEESCRMRETPAVAGWTAYAATQPHLSVRAVTRNSSA